MIERQKQIPLAQHVPLFVHLARLEDVHRFNSNLLVRCFIYCKVYLSEGTLANILHNLIVVKFGLGLLLGTWLAILFLKIGLLNHT